MERPNWKYFREIRVANGAAEAVSKRLFESADIVCRLGAISGNRVFLNNYPIDNPRTVLNPSILVSGEEIRLYLRVIIGYYMYVSGIAETTVPLEDVLNRNISENTYSATLSVYPSTSYDLWGTEDPRVFQIKDKVILTYCGRTINYFNPALRQERTVPMLAVKEPNEPSHGWEKKAFFRLPSRWRGHVISDKDSFLVESEGQLFLFHRPHLDDEGHYLLVSRISQKFEELIQNGVKEIQVSDPVQILWPAKFEEKIGWATPPIRLRPKEYVVLIHAVGREMKAYKVMAVQLEFDQEISVKAVTPRYIMVPQTPYEVFGDRPHTIFPCGVSCYQDDKYLISYGAADHFAAIGEFNLNDLLAELDKGRIF